MKKKKKKQGKREKKEGRREAAWECFSPFRYLSSDFLFQFFFLLLFCFFSSFPLLILQYDDGHSLLVVMGVGGTNALLCVSVTNLKKRRRRKRSKNVYVVRHIYIYIYISFHFFFHLLFFFYFFVPSKNK